jgi:hypothetical protein
MGSSKCSEKSPPRTARPDMMQPVTSKGRKKRITGGGIPSPRYFYKFEAISKVFKNA